MKQKSNNNKNNALYFIIKEFELIYMKLMLSLPLHRAFCSLSNTPTNAHM